MNCITTYVYRTTAQAPVRLQLAAVLGMPAWCTYAPQIGPYVGRAGIAGLLDIRYVHTSRMSGYI